MGSSPTIAIGMVFVDRDGNRAKATSYCAISVPKMEAWSMALALASAMQSLSSAVLVRIELTWRYTVDAPALASIDADMSRRILLLIQNDAGEINGIVIPSPAPIWETIGPYAGIRLDLANAGAVGFADMLSVVDLRTDDNRAVGTLLAAGGLVI